MTQFYKRIFLHFDTSKSEVTPSDDLLGIPKK